MGTGCLKHKASPTSFLDISQQPSQLVQPIDPGAPQLQYQVSLSNISIRNLLVDSKTKSLKTVCVQIDVDGLIDKVFEQKKVEGVVKWNTRESVIVKRTSYELSKMFLTINAFSDDRRKIGGVKVNLYQVSVGPYRHDLPLGTEEKDKLRIGFDLKISPIVEIQIQPKQVKVQLNTQHPGESFHYTLSTIDDNGQTFQTDASYNAQTKLFSKVQGGNSPSETSAKLQRRLSLRKRQSVILTAGQKLAWTSVEAQKLYSMGLPSLQIFANASKIENYGFQILLWRVKAEVEGSNSDILEEHSQLYSESYINLTKVCKNQKSVEIIEKIWSEGKLFGLIKMNCDVSIPEVTKQLTGFIRTQNGIVPKTQFHTKMSSFSASASCLQIKELITLKTTIQSEVLTLNSEQNLKSQYKTTIIKNSIIQKLKKMEAILNSQIKIFRYKNYEELIKGQTALIRIGTKILESIQNGNSSINQIYWKLYLSLINRQQFSLQNWEFSEQEKECIKSGEKRSRLLQQKILVRIEYQKFLYRTTKFCLNSLTRKAIIENQRLFSVVFYAQAYFQIPQIHKFVNQTIEHPEDIKAINQMGLALVMPTEEPPHFDWQTTLYQPIKQEPGYKQNKQYLQEVLENPIYSQKLHQRRSSFFCLVVECLEYVCKVMQGKTINWLAVPGYINLVKAFVCQMHSRPIQKYSDMMQQASVHLLINKDLLNVFVRILFSKTNVYSKTQIINTLDLIDRYFSYLTKSQPTLPASFDYKYFYAGIKLILGSQHSYVISKCLEVIYHHYSHFSSHFKYDISMYLLGKVFFKMFLSWSQLVRMVFHNIMINRINLECNFSEYQKTQRLEEGRVRDIKERYEKCIVIVKNAQKVRSKTEYFTPNLSNHYYKQMKQKLIDIRFKKVKNSSRIKKCSKDIESLLDLNELSTNRTISTPIEPTFPYPQHKASMHLQVNTEPLKPKTRKASSNLLSPNDQPPTLQKKRILSRSYEVDQQLTESDLKSFIAYLECSMIGFSIIEETFRKRMPPSYSHADAPEVKLRFPVDEGDIRPDDIDQL